MEKKEIEKLIEAGKILKQSKEYARGIVKKGMPLLELAEKIEAKILELGGKPAFPVNLSINEVAAHYTPAWDDKSVASGLLKVDIGIHVDGYVADSAFSVDLENSALNKNLIEAAELALKNASEKVKYHSTLGEIGREIENAIKSKGVLPVQNLSGHLIERYDLHAGITIPNYDSKQELELEEGSYAIEPFSTNGLGAIRDGKPSGIYSISNEGNVRDTFAREVLKYVYENYQTLPFCSRWIYKKFGSRGLLALKQIDQAGILHSYAQLIEKGQGIVAQAEHTIIITKKEKIITT